MKAAFLKLHLAVFLAGFTGILGRLITLNEGWLVWYRLLISSITMWILFHFTRKLQRISAKQRWQITGIGFLAALHWVTFYGSIKYANVSIALVCFSAIGFFTALIEPLFFRKRIQPMELLLGLVCIVAIYLIFHFDPRYKTGIIIGLISAFLAAIFPVMDRMVLAKVNPETLITYKLSGGWLTLSLLMPWYTMQFPADHIIPTWTDFFWLLFLAWLCSVWAFRLSAQALQKISAFTVNISYNLEPVYGIVLAFLVYQENKLLHSSFYIGFAMILIVVAYQTWRVAKKKSQ